MIAFSRLRRLVHLRHKFLPDSIKHFKGKFRNCYSYKTLLCPMMFATTTFYNMNIDMPHNSFMKSSEEIEEEIVNKVFGNPEPELLELMDVLENCIVESCAQYRICIKKQIEIIEQSSRNGIFSNDLDELPEYRTLASDLSHELNNYVVLLKTLGEMTYQHLISSAKGESFKDVNLISSKYKNLEILLQKELDENRKLETELNNANRIMILNTHT